MAKSKSKLTPKVDSVESPQEAHSPVDASDVDFSSDEEHVEIEGISAGEVKPSRSGHTVNLSKERNTDSKTLRKARSHLYVGNLPKNFQQYELKKYFSQFGDVSRARLSRNKKTGKSRLYGFVEFVDANSAEVAAETMDNYLLAGSNIKVQVLKDHADNLFSSKMKSSFGEFDWRKKEHDQYNAPKPEAEWQELEQQFEARKKAKIEELKSAGFDYALEA